MSELLMSVDWARIAGSLVLVVVAGVLGYWQHAGLTGDLVMATVRSFIQLIAIGYALELVFAQDSMIWTLVIIAVMLAVAAYTSAQRGKGIPHALLITNASIGIGAILTIGLLVAFRVFEFSPRFTIPIAGMVIGNSMTTCSLVMGRLSANVSPSILRTGTLPAGFMRINSSPASQYLSCTNSTSSFFSARTNRTLRQNGERGT